VHRLGSAAFAAAFAALVAVFCFHHLARPDVRTWDEGMNTAVVIATLDSGSFPVLQGPAGPFFEKPPLWYYLTLASVRLGGLNATSLRMVTALSGFLLILLVGIATARFHSVLAGYAASGFLLAVGHLYFFKPHGIFSTHHIRSADSDILQALFMFAAFFAFSFVRPGRHAGLYVGAGLAGLAVLTKGPLGILPILVLGLHQVISRREDRLSLRPALLAGALLLLVVVPWHAAMAWRFGPPFLQEYAGYHLLHRVMGTVEEHAGPWFYYLRLLTGRRILFSVELAAIALVAPLFQPRMLLRYPTFGAVAHVVLLLVLLSTMQTKLAWYLMPVYPFAAVLVGGLMEQLRGTAQDPTRRLPLRASAAFGAVLVLLAIAGYAVRNLRGIERLRPEWEQVFFEKTLARCTSRPVYVDARLPFDLAYLLRRHGIRREDALAAGCVIAWRDTTYPEEERHEVETVLAKGHLKLLARPGAFH